LLISSILDTLNAESASLKRTYLLTVTPFITLIFVSLSAMLQQLWKQRNAVVVVPRWYSKKPPARDSYPTKALSLVKESETRTVATRESNSLMLEEKGSGL
jgi:hypothetical protein